MNEVVWPEWQRGEPPQGIDEVVVFKPNTEPRYARFMGRRLLAEAILRPTDEWLVDGSIQPWDPAWYWMPPPPPPKKEPT